MSLTGRPRQTSTFRSRPSDAPNPAQNSGSSNAASSPPLILAFIAAGFLGAGIIIFFLYRRAVARRTRSVTTPSNDHVVASKPILWDVRIDKSPMDGGKSSLKGCKWPGITPLSAAFTSLHHPPTLETPPSPPQKMMHDLARFFTRPRCAQTPIALKQSPLASRDIHGSNTLVQVAVLVAMPSPTRSVLYGIPDTKRSQEDEYHLGLTKVPCIEAQPLGH